MKLLRREKQDRGALAPLPELNRIRKEINRIFEDPFGFVTAPTSFFEGWSPSLDIFEDKDKITVRTELPGMRKEDIEISLQDGTLTIGGERTTTSENGENAERTERFSGKFRRSITLPARVDSGKVSAAYKDGILTITLPKAEEAKPKQIKVNVD